MIEYNPLCSSRSATAVTENVFGKQLVVLESSKVHMYGGIHLMWICRHGSYGLTRLRFIYGNDCLSNIPTASRAKLANSVYRLLCFIWRAFCAICSDRTCARGWCNALTLECPDTLRVPLWAITQTREDIWLSPTENTFIRTVVVHFETFLRSKVQTSFSFSSQYQTDDGSSFRSRKDKNCHLIKIFPLRIYVHEKCFLLLKQQSVPTPGESLSIADEPFFFGLRSV